MLPQARLTAVVGYWDSS